MLAFLAMAGRCVAMAGRLPETCPPLPEMPYCNLHAMRGALPAIASQITTARGGGSHTGNTIQNRLKLTHTLKQ